ncbi:hypothetical protein SMMN14_06888 [Sphaerulina musiva]
MQLWIALAIAPSVFAGSLPSRSLDLVSRDTKEGDRPYPPAFCLCRSGDEDGPVDTAATDTTLTQVVCKQVPDSTFKIYDSPDKDPLHGGCFSYYFIDFFFNINESMEYFDPKCREVSKQCQYWAECWGGDGTVEQGQVMAKGNPNGTCGEQKGPSEEEEKKKKKREEEKPVLLSTRTPQLTDDDVPPFDEPFCLCKYGAETDDMGDKTLTQDACTHVPDSQYFVYENSAGDLQGGCFSYSFEKDFPDINATAAYFQNLCTTESGNQCQYFSECWGGGGTTDDGQVVARGNHSCPGDPPGNDGSLHSRNAPVVLPRQVE